MLKVFLVEDETVIREGLRDHIPWDRYGYRLVGEASDGEMALPLIRKTRPDLIITDIKMPFMDGLSLSRMVKEEFPKTKIVILSGYDDFEYARRAITIGVDQYILKPVTRASIRTVLQEIREKIEREQKQEDYQTKLADEMREYEQFSMRHFFEKMLEGELSVTEIYDEAAKKSLDLSASGYNLIFLYMQEKKGLPESNVNHFVQTQEEILHYFLRFPQYILFRWNIEGYGILVKGDWSRIEEETGQALEQIRMVCEADNGDYDWYAAVSDPVERLSLLPDCYDRVRQYSAYRFIYPNQHFFTKETLQNHIGGLDDTQISEVEYSKMAPEIIQDFLAKGSRNEVYDFVESYLQNIIEAMNSAMFRDYIVLNIRFAILAFVDSIGAEKKDFEERIGNYQESVHIAREQVKDYFAQMLFAAMAIRDEQTSSQSGRTLKNAMDYIDAHYTDESITLGSVACEVQVSANYLSSVFSQNMKQTFTEYITDKRMDKAKKLLRSTDLATAEIAAQVGYKDPHYFSFVFKKTLGTSPREYRSGRGI